MAGFTQFETSDRVLNTRMNAFGNELYSQITKYSTYDLYLKQGNLMNPQKPTGAGTEVLFANVTDVEKLAYTFNYAIPENLIISKDNRYNLVIPFKQLDANRSFIFRFLYKHEGNVIFDITRNAVTTSTGNLTVEFQALNQNIVDITALANTTVTLQIFVKTTSGTDAQISLLVNDVNTLGRLSRNEATAIVSADNVLMPDGVTSVSSAIGQKANSVNAELTGTAKLNGKEIATTEVIAKTLTATNGATGTVYMSRTAGKVIAIDAVLTVSSSIPAYTNFCGILAADRPVRDVQFDMKLTNGTQKILCIVNANSGFQTLSQSIPAGTYLVAVSYIAGT